MKKLFVMMLLLVTTLSSGLTFAKEGTVLEGTINVNVATIEELMLLPGIGEVKAKAIIDARTQKPFAKKEDLLVVKGIGDKSLAKWSAFIALDGKTTLREATSTAQNLQTAPTSAK